MQSDVTTNPLTPLRRRLATASRLIAALAVLTLVAPDGAGATAARSPTVVGPRESIQSAVDTAAAGDTILVFGTHRENVAIQTDRLTLRGVGATVLPPATPAAHACFDATVVDEAVHGICVLGDVDFDTGEVSRRVDGVTVSDFTIRGFTGSGLVAIGANATTFTRNVAAGNGDAAISAFLSTNTRVLSNRASGGRFGVFASASSGGRVFANVLHDNCVGILALDLGAGPSGGFDIAANTIRHNTKPCAANEDFPPLSGVGVALFGGAHNRVVSNLITGNVPAPGAPTAISAGVAVVTSPAGPEPAHTVVAGNAILRNDPDLFWDETGPGNILRPNRCRTSIPAGLC